MGWAGERRLSRKGDGQWENEATGRRVFLATVRPQLCSCFHDPKLTRQESGRAGTFPQDPQGHHGLLEAHASRMCKTQFPTHREGSVTDSNLNKQSTFSLVGGTGREKQGKDQELPRSSDSRTRQRRHRGDPPHLVPPAPAQVTTYLRFHSHICPLPS